MSMGEEVGRLEERSLEGQLLWELEHGFELSPRESEGILETVRLLYADKPEARAGRVVPKGQLKEIIVAEVKTKGG